MACRRCTPELEPTGPQRVGHFAIRFGDWRLSVLKDEVVTNDCYEVDTLAGLAWRYRYPLRSCACGGHAEAYIDEGSFRVVEGVASG